MNQWVVAYCSDRALLDTNLRPHGTTLWAENITGASLDHAVWFHRQTSLDRWHLYDLQSDWTGGARGLARGYLYDPDGHLVASVCQEGMIRVLDDSLPKSEAR